VTLAIPRKHIFEVMIGNKWIGVFNQSFTIDSYEFVYEYNASGEALRDDDGRIYVASPEVSVFGGSSGVTYVGFSFECEHGEILSGPMTAIQCVKWDDRVVTLGPKAIEMLKENAS
jgi:hypothetical protein